MTTSFSSLTFAGHSATFFTAPGVTVAIDPWLEANPLCPPALKNPSALDVIVLTHGHADHAGEAASLAKRYGSVVIATWELAMLMVQEGVPQGNVVPMNKGGTYSMNGVSVTLTHAMHSSSYDTPQGAVYAGEPVGVVLRDSLHTIYHAGDTALFGDMALLKEFYSPDIALLPIGDRFTMGPREAVAAAKLIGARRVIPIHYGTFDMLTGSCEEFCKLSREAGVEVVVLEPGGSLSL